MRFPLSKIDEKEYYKKIFSLIEDDECHIFIDTNIIALFYGIHDSARKEFFNWLNQLILKNRIKVPTWVINEYSNRFIRNQIQDYLGPLNKVSTLKKDFDQISSFLKMHIDSSSLINSKYASLDEFQNDLIEIKEKIEKIAFIAKSKDEKYKLKIHDEINQVLGNCIIDTDIDVILENINSLGLIRYFHKIPPGFKDEKKDLNAHGDLILWYEILGYCKEKDVKKVVLITNDEKKDWVYAPYKLIVNSREVNNSKPLKVADPRLIHEFKTVTNSEDFYIINFELLTQILIENISNSFTNLARALQLVHKQTKEDESETPEFTLDDNSVLDNNIIEPEVTSNETSELSTETISEQTVKHEEELPEKYSRTALADRDFPLIDNTYFTQVIEQLKTYNWYKQNPCIDEFLKFDSTTLKESQPISDKLFVVGRNIYQSACGGSASAVDFIKNLRHKFTKFTDYFINNLYSGVLYEIYFDSASNFRVDKLKSYYINEVVSLIDLDRLKPSIDFIKQMLTPFESKLLYIPYKNDKVKIEPFFDDKVIEIDDWLEGKINYLQLKSLMCNGKEMLTDDINQSLNIYFPNPNLQGLISLICETYGIPKNQIELKSDTTINEKLNITLGDKKLATTKTICQLPFPC